MSRVYSGISDADSTPSPNRFCRKLGNPERGEERIGGVGRRPKK